MCRSKLSTIMQKLFKTNAAKINLRYPLNQAREATEIKSVDWAYQTLQSLSNKYGYCVKL
jgi:hypothetical protein